MQTKKRAKSVDSEAAPVDPRRSWAALVEQKLATGLSRVEAIKAAGRERPELYEAQTTVPSDLAPPDVPVTRHDPSAKVAKPISWDGLIERIMREHKLDRVQASIKALRDHQAQIER